MKLKFTYSLILLFIINTTKAQVPEETNINTWKVAHLPKNTDTLEEYGYNGPIWKVYLRDSNVYVSTKYDKPYHLPFTPNPLTEKEHFDMRSIKAVAEAEDGFLVVFNTHRFNVMYWFSKDGKKNQRINKLFSRFIGFVKQNNKILALSGHPGGLKEISKVAGIWTLSDYIDIPYTAYGMYEDKSDIYIATASGIFAVNEKRECQSIIESGIWAPYQTPTSIVIMAPYVYIGLRKGVVRYNWGADKQEWLLPE